MRGFALHECATSAAFALRKLHADASTKQKGGPTGPALGSQRGEGAYLQLFQ
jgi:hypothetical protein